MVGLDNKLRAQGGRNRAENQRPEERRFQAMVAASRRPLLHDANTSPEVLVAALKELESSRHWFCVFIVGADRTKIGYTNDAEVLRKVKAHGAIGFLGVTMLGDRVQAYSKPLKRGLKVIEDLERVSRDVMSDVLDKLGHTKLQALEG